MKTYAIPVIAVLALLLSQSCDKNTHEVFAPDELGMVEHEFYIGKDGGDLEIPFIANKKVFPFRSCSFN